MRWDKDLIGLYKGFLSLKKSSIDGINLFIRSLRILILPLAD